VDKGGVAISIDAMNVRQAAGDVPGDPKPGERRRFGGLHEVPKGFPELRDDRMPAKAEDVHHVRRLGEAFHRHGIDTIVLKVLIFKPMFNPEQREFSSANSDTQQHGSPTTHGDETYFSVFKTTVSRCPCTRPGVASTVHAFRQ